MYGLPTECDVMHENNQNATAPVVEVRTHVQQTLHAAGATWRSYSAVIMSIYEHCWCMLMSHGCDGQDYVGQVLVNISQLQPQQCHQDASTNLFLPDLLLKQDKIQARSLVNPD